MIYYCRENQGFYHSEVHGARQIEVVDDVATAKEINRASEKDKAEFEAATSEDGDYPKRADFQKRARKARANPILKTIDNPDTRIPATAVEISQERYDKLMAAQAEGKVITADKNGQPQAADRTLDPAEIMQIATQQRDRLLRESDWTQIRDAVLSIEEQKAWADYRQQLRDLPATIDAMTPAALKKITGIAELLPTPPQ